MRRIGSVALYIGLGVLLAFGIAWAYYTWPL